MDAIVVATFVFSGLVVIVNVIFKRMEVMGWETRWQTLPSLPASAPTKSSRYSAKRPPPMNCGSACSRCPGASVVTGVNAPPDAGTRCSPPFRTPTMMTPSSLHDPPPRAGRSASWTGGLPSMAAFTSFTSVDW